MTEENKNFPQELLDKVAKTEYVVETILRMTTCTITTNTGFKVNGSHRVIWTPVPGAKDSKTLAFESAMRQLAILETYHQHEKNAEKPQLALLDSGQCMKMVATYQQDQAGKTLIGTSNWSAGLGNAMMREVARINPTLESIYTNKKEN